MSKSFRRDVGQVASVQLQVFQVGQVIEWTWLDSSQRIVREIELVQVRRIVEELSIELADTARVQVEVEQGTTI